MKLSSRDMSGHPSQLAFELSWPAEDLVEMEGLGWGHLVVWFAGGAVWSAAWTWIDLVEHLARSWSSLVCEEMYPFGLVAAGPEVLRTRALLTSVPGRTAIEVEDAVHAFQHRHDLAAGLKGITLTSIWLLREETRMRLRVEGNDLWLPCAEVLSTLKGFVDVVRTRIVAPAARSLNAFACWDQRVLEPRYNS